MGGHCCWMCHFWLVIIGCSDDYCCVLRSAGDYYCLMCHFWLEIVERSDSCYYVMIVQAAVWLISVNSARLWRQCLCCC